MDLNGWFAAFVPSPLHHDQWSTSSTKWLNQILVTDDAKKFLAPVRAAMSDRHAGRRAGAPDPRYQARGAITCAIALKIQPQG